MIIIIRLLIAESYDITDDNLITYYGNSTHKGIPPFNFKFITQIHNSSSASDIKQRISDEWIKLLPENSSTNWVVRISTKLKIILSKLKIKFEIILFLLLDYIIRYLKDLYIYFLLH